MTFFKKHYLFHAFFIFLLLGCSTDEQKNDANENTGLEINVTNFEPSPNQVVIDWEIIKPNAITIKDVFIYKTSKIDETDVSPEELIATLSPDDTSFTDTDIPYKREISYTIKITYTDESISAITLFDLESEPKKYIRNIVLFDRVPFQVYKDPVQANIFHILDKEGIGYLKKYDGALNQITQTKNFTQGSLLNNRFHIINNTAIYVAETQGKITNINTATYETTATYNVAITDNLNAFAVDGDRIYYQDEEIWKYYTISSGFSTNTYIATSIDYAEALTNHDFLFLYSQNGSAASIRNYNPTNCNTSDCFPDFGPSTQGAILANNAIDPNIFTWNPLKTKFITSIDGRIFNLSNFQEEIKLSDITGKKYFQFAIDNENNIYATVQNEKKIHKFNSNHELIEIINTKLYPFFPMITTNGLKVIAGYAPITYWSFGYGYNFNFNIRCAIETF